MADGKAITMALAGQPNVGKSTVFNLVTGLNQHVGNWPGKTVEQRTGSFEHDGVQVKIVDLPGTYCLTAGSPEEVIARDYIIHEQPDVVLVVINAASLERNLYLVAELVALPAPLVIGLNMMDVAQQEGFEIEPDVLAAALGVPVIPMVARRAEGVHELIDAGLRVARQDPAQEPSRPAIREDHRKVLEHLYNLIEGYVPEPYTPEWIALKLLEGDQQVTEMMRHSLHGERHSLHGERQSPPDEQQSLTDERWAEVEAILKRHEDALIAVASGRYEWIRRMTRAALVRPRAGRITLTHRLDTYATHPFWGLVILAAVMAAIFFLTYGVGAPLQQLMSTHLIGGAAEGATRLLAGAPQWLVSLVVQGVIGGVGTMITFVPILLIFFIVMGLLEDIGYMARAAYVMDRFMHVMGLHGKSFIPLFLGFGCNVPAIMGARIIDATRARLLTIMLAPLVPCTGRLAVLAILVPVFFPQHTMLVSWGLTALPILVLALTGAIVGRLFTRSESAAFIMEMPLYHVPNWRTIGILVWTRISAFLVKAGTVILLVSVIVWLFASLPEGDIETSYLARVGQFLTPVGAWMGLGWKPLVALMASFVAKENSVATLGVLYGVGGDTTALFGALSASLSPASALAFLTAQMLFVPCVSTVAAIRQETRSWLWTGVNIVFLVLITLMGGTVVYQIARWVL
jgi:ferrous iron transport protein B